MIGEHLNWNYHVDTLAPKHARAIGMLTKITHYVSKSTPRTIYFGIVAPILTYGAHIWSQIHNKSINRILKLQNTTIRVVNFALNDNQQTIFTKILKY